MAARDLLTLMATARLDRLGQRTLGCDLRLADATSPAARFLGLAGLDEMPSDLGLRFTRCRSVHTFGMRFALDLVWLDAQGTVARIDRDVPPRRVRSCRAARAVIETSAGQGDRFARAL